MRYCERGSGISSLYWGSWAVKEAKGEDVDGGEETDCGFLMLYVALEVSI